MLSVELAVRDVPPKPRINVAALQLVNDDQLAELNEALDDFKDQCDFTVKSMGRFAERLTYAEERLANQDRQIREVGDLIEQLENTVAAFRDRFKDINKTVNETGDDLENVQQACEDMVANHPDPASLDAKRMKRTHSPTTDDSDATKKVAKK